MGKLNGKTQLAIWIVSTVFFAGIAFATIYFNSQNISENVVRIDKNVAEISTMQKTLGKIDVRQETMVEDIKLIKRAVLHQ